MNLISIFHRSDTEKNIIFTQAQKLLVNGQVVDAKRRVLIQIYWVQSFTQANLKVEEIIICECGEQFY